MVARIRRRPRRPLSSRHRPWPGDTREHLPRCRRGRRARRSDLYDRDAAVTLHGDVGDLAALVRRLPAGALGGRGRGARAGEGRRATDDGRLRPDAPRRPGRHGGRLRRRSDRQPDRGPDAGQCLPRDRERPRDRPGREQDRPAAGRPRRSVGRGRRSARRRPRARRPHLGQDRRERRRRARRDHRARATACGRPGGAAARARLRLVLRPVPRRRRVRPHRRRRVLASRRPAGHGERHALRGGGARLLLADDDAGRHALRGRGRLRRDGPEGRLDPAGRRHPHVGQATREQRAARLQGRQADGVRRSLPDRLGRLPGAARRARAAEAQRRRALLRAGDVAGARLRLPLRLPRPLAHGDRSRTPRARVRSRSARDCAECRLSRAGEERRLARGPQPGGVPARGGGGGGAVREVVDHRARRSSSAP